MSPNKQKTTYKKPQKKKRKVFVPVSKKVKIVVVSGIIVCVVAVLVNLLATQFLSPDKVAQAKLEQLASDYYENYYYDKFIASIPKGKPLEKAMSEFEKDGFSPVYLRHLLLFDNERNKNEAKYFETSNYACDKNETSIRIIPMNPYSRKDYTISYSLSCNYK